MSMTVDAAASAGERGDGPLLGSYGTAGRAQVDDATRRQAAPRPSAGNFSAFPLSILAVHRKCGSAAASQPSAAATTRRQLAFGMGLSIRRA
jgi:hypothetical protein